MRGLHRGFPRSFLVLQVYDGSIRGTKHVPPVLCCLQLDTRHCLRLHQLHFGRYPCMCWGFSEHHLAALCGTVIGRSGLVLAWRIPFLTPHWFTLVATHIRCWEYLSHRNWQILQFRNLPHPITRADLPVPTNGSGTTPSTARKQGSSVKNTVDRAQLSNLDLEFSFCAALDLMQ